jgi:hypothetical protein
MVSLRVNIITEQVFGYVWKNCYQKKYDFNMEYELHNWTELNDFVKRYDSSGYWLKHYHNLFSEQDGTYLENMFFTLRRRYNKPFNGFYPQPQYNYIKT